MASNPPADSSMEEYEFEQMNLQVGGRIQFITHRTLKPVQHFSTIIGWVNTAHYTLQQNLTYEALIADRQKIV